MTTPGAVLIDSLFIDLHTMFWHTAVFLLGVLQWAGGAFERGVRSYLAACAFFVLLVAVALIVIGYIVMALMAIPMYAYKGEQYQEGVDYSLDDVESVEGKDSK